MYRTHDRKHNLTVKQQHTIKISISGRILLNYKADFLYLFRQWHRRYGTSLQCLVKVGSIIKTIFPN